MLNLHKIPVMGHITEMREKEKKRQSRFDPMTSKLQGKHSTTEHKSNAYDYSK